jgi:hypothetical protein
MVLRAMVFDSRPKQQRNLWIAGHSAIGEEDDPLLTCVTDTIQRRLKSRLQRHCTDFSQRFLDLEIFEVVTNRCGEAPVDQQ